MHDHSGDRRKLAGALALIVGLLVAEIAVGIVAGSLALLADAGHMLTDAAALSLALVAAAVAARPPVGSWTFGFRRVEILAALANGITLALVGIWIVYEAVRRLVSPTDVHGGLVLVLAGAGIAVNLAAAALLERPSRTSLNIRGAFLHVATAAATSASARAAASVSMCPASASRASEPAMIPTASSATSSPAMSASAPASLRRSVPWSCSWPPTARS